MQTDGEHQPEYDAIIKAGWAAYHSKEQFWQVPGNVQHTIRTYTKASTQLWHGLLERDIAQHRSYEASGPSRCA